MSRKKLTREVVRTAAARVYADKIPMRRVAKDLGVTYYSLYRAFKREGFPLPGHWSQAAAPIRPETFERAKRLGWTKREMARRLGVDHSRVIREQARQGIEWPERDGVRSTPRSKGRGVVPKQKD